VKKSTFIMYAAASIIIVGCGEGNSASNTAATRALAAGQSSSVPAPTERPPATWDTSYVPPTAEEIAPLRPEYAAELAKIHEPPEMAGKPMQVRKAVSPDVLKLGTVITALGSPDKASHQQRVLAIRQLQEIADSNGDDGIDRRMIYGVIAITACLDGADPQTIIGYANSAIGDDDDDALALRARMYLQAGDQGKALDDLEKIMRDGKRQSLAGGDTDPRQATAACGWSLPDIDRLGDDPRAIAVKGFYLSAFIGYGAEARGTVNETSIQDLFARSARSWRSPIPHLLAVSVEGLGSEHSMAGARCIRANSLVTPVPEIAGACATYDEGVRRDIRELTMALVIDPTFEPALSERADKYLQLAQASYADGKPTRQLFESALRDFTAAIAVGAKDSHALNCDRSLALASLGRYQDAASGYVQGMKLAKSGTEDSPFVYEQLAGIDMKLGKFNEAANVLTQAIMNATGGGLDSVIFGGGIKAFRELYPEYDLLPDEILADVVRRRFQPQFPQSWDRDFISKGGAFKGKVASTILPDLYALRGDAYMKAGRRAEALADYRRLKSDAWDGPEPSLPRHVYFDERGARNFDSPEPWPPMPPSS
jgi:tetratricopeptide (TPR) repeat protein